MLNRHGNQMKTLILVDLDNFNSPHQISTILTFYTKDTKFEFFGLRSQNKKKIASRYKMKAEQVKDLNAAE